MPMVSGVHHQSERRAVVSRTAGFHQSYARRGRASGSFVFWCVGGTLLLAVGLAGAAQGAGVVLEDLGSSPSQCRWLDVADQAYSAAYRGDYDYTQSVVAAAYTEHGPVLAGALSGSGLKPNFTYQMKLVGAAETASDEQIGLTGRWWQEEWSGTQWTNGQNLNDKGDGSSPNPNDLLYFARRDVANASSPTGKHYRFTGYMVLGYFTTSELGEVDHAFWADSSYHVLWKTTQRARTVQDGPLETATFDPNPAIHPAYGVDYAEATVSIFGEWERLPVGGVKLPDGHYVCQLVLTEESFHGSGGTYAGNWAAAVGGSVEFTIAPATHVLSVDSDPIGGVQIEGTAPDTTPYSAVLPDNTGVSLTAPDSAMDGGTQYEFVRWTLDGTPQPLYLATLTFSISEDTTAVAEYQTVSDNEPPVADAGPDRTALPGEQIRFNGNKSHDADGRIILHEWDFDDDGLYDATGRKVRRTFWSPGSYVVRLRVTDNDGATDTDTCVVTVQESTAHVAAIDLSASTHGKWTKVPGTVTVHDQDGQGVSKATVHVTWSVNGGDVQSASADTNRKGNASFKLRSDTLSTGDIVVLTVDNVITAGPAYDPVANAEDSDQIVIP